MGLTLNPKPQTLAAQIAKRKTQRFEPQMKTQVQNAALQEGKRSGNATSNLKTCQNAGFESRMRKRKIRNAKRKYKIQNAQTKHRAALVPPVCNIIAQRIKTRDSKREIQNVRFEIRNVGFEIRNARFGQLRFRV